MIVIKPIMSMSMLHIAVKEKPYAVSLRTEIPSKLFTQGTLQIATLHDYAFYEVASRNCKANSLN